MVTSAIHIRSATLEDASAIATAHVRGWQVAYKGIVPDAFLDSMDVDERTSQWRENLQLEVLANGRRAPTNYVAEIDNQVVGFACVGDFRADLAADAPGDSGEIWAMYVHPDHWGAGAGYALMQATVAHFKEHNVATGHLWVLEDNAAARHFYERQRWTATNDTIQIDIGGAPLVERRYTFDVPHGV